MSEGAIYVVQPGDTMERSCRFSYGFIPEEVLLPT